MARLELGEQFCQTRQWHVRKPVRVGSSGAVSGSQKNHLIADLEAKFLHAASAWSGRGEVQQQANRDSLFDRRPTNSPAVLDMQPLPIATGKPEPTSPGLDGQEQILGFLQRRPHRRHNLGRFPGSRILAAEVRFHFNALQRLQLVDEQQLWGRLLRKCYKSGFKPAVPERIPHNWARIPEAALLGRSPRRTRTGGVLRDFHAFGVIFTHPSCRPAAMSHDIPQAKTSLHDHWSYISRTWSPLIWTLKIRVCDSERRR